MEITPSSELVFQRSDDSYSTVLLCNNATQTQFYKIKTTAPKTFTVKPNKGLVPPGETVTITVTLCNKSEFHPDRKGDRFLIETIIIPDDIKGDEKAAADYMEAAKLARKAGKTGVDFGTLKLSAVYSEAKMPAPSVSDYVEKGIELLIQTNTVCQQ